MRTAWLGLIALTALGCGDETLSPAPLERRTIDAGNATIEVTTTPSIELFRDGELLLSLGPDGFQLGLIDAASDDHNYDPYRLYDPSPLYDVPEGLSFAAPERARFEGEGVALSLAYRDGITATVTIAASQDGVFQLVWTPSDPSSEAGRTAFMRLAPDASADEGFYGLGEYFDAVDHRGKVRAMQIEAGGPLESAYNEAHVPVPFVIGTRGWGMFVASPYPGAFALAVEDDRRIEASFGTGTASRHGLTVHLMAAAHPLDVTKLYYDITGYPKLPARWALGPLVWRDENLDQAEVERDLDAIRDLDLATTGLWIDRPYATGVNTFDFDTEKFPDPQAMIDKMHALGFRVGLWHTPYLDEQDAATAALREQADAGGYYPVETAINLNGWGTPIDLTNEAARAWWQGLIAQYVDMGIEGFKLDYGEDILNGLFFERTPWTFADGSDERTMHAQYTLHYHRTYAEMLPADGYFLLCRAGTYGDQQHGPIIWPGDLDATFARHGERVDQGGERYTGVGGLPASIIAGLSLGPSGFPFYGADTGGYKHTPTDKELFMRWFEQTAFSSVMQIGTGANDVAWELGGDNGFDQQMLDSYRIYTRLHLRLFPYLWSHAERLAHDGRPIQRALGLAHPELGIHPDDIYLLGDALLVAPVVERGATRRTVHFPAGRWVHWFTGEIVEGPTEADIDAPLGRLPVFLSDAGLVPMLRPSIDTLAPTTEPDRVDSYADDPGVLYVRAVAGGTATFELFDGGMLSIDSAGATTTVASRSGSELDRGAIFEILASPPPASVGVDPAADLPSLEAASEGWFHDGSTLWVKLAAGERETTIAW